MINIVKMLAVDEGICYKAYKDTVGKTTVGIGFNMDDKDSRSIWIKADIPESFNHVYDGTENLSAQSILNIFKVCTDNAKNDLISIFTNFNTFPDYVQLALINLMFNMGKNTFSQFHTTIALIKEGKYNDAADNLQHTRWKTQVGKRADRVMALLKGDYSLYTSCDIDSRFNGS